MKRRALSVFLLTLAFALLAGCRSAGPRAEPASAAVSSLTVVTLNLWHDKQDWPHRQDLIVAELQSLRPDVILLQEVLQHEALPNQAASLARRLGYQYRFFSADEPGQARRYGNAILVRTPVQQSRETRLEPLDDYRNAGWVRTEIDGQPLNIYVTHLHYKPEGGDIRARQLSGLQAFIAATRGDAPAVIGGDFNTPASSPELRPLLRDYADAYAGAHAGTDVDTPAHTTLNTHLGHPPTRIDHVLFQRDAFRVAEARIILDQADSAGAWPSDHYGVWARLERLPR